MLTSSLYITSSTFPKIHQPSRVPRKENDQYPLLLAAVITASVVFALAAVVIIILLFRKIRKKSRGNRRPEPDENNGNEWIPLQVMLRNRAGEEQQHDVERFVVPEELPRFPVQATPSSVRIGG